MARDLVQSLLFGRKSEFDVGEVSNIIENAYLARARPNGHVQKKTFAPSSLGGYQGTCPRYWYLAFTGGEFVYENDAMGIANMAYGTDAHTRIQALLKESGTLIAEEVEVKLQDPPIRGFIDVIMRVGEETVIGEIKTTRAEYFVHRQTSGKPTYPHLLQVLIYMKATGKKHGFVLYENKNDQTLLVIPVDFTKTNEQLLEDAFEWLREVYKAYEAKTLPMRPYRKQTGQVCAKCPLNKVCWEDNEEGVVKLPKMEVPAI